MKKRQILSWLLLTLVFVSVLPNLPAQAGYNPLRVSTYGQGVPVYSSSLGSQRAGILYNGYNGSLSLSPTNDLYSLNLTRDFEIWIDQEKAQQNPQNTCNAFLAEITHENAPLYAHPNTARITAKHAKGTRITVWGEFGDYYFVEDYSGLLQGFFLKSHLQKISDLSYAQAHAHHMGAETIQQSTVYTDGGTIFRSSSATGYSDNGSYWPLQDGETVNIIADLGAWVQLADGGFIESRFLDPNGDHSHGYARVKSDQILDRLNVRSHASTDAWVEAKLCAGTRVEIISHTDEWAYIHVTGETGGASYSGCVKLEFLALDESEPVLDGTIPVRLKRAVYGGNAPGYRYRDSWHSDNMLPAGTELTIVGVEGNYNAEINEADIFLALTEDGQLISIYDDGGIFEPQESSGIFAKPDSSLKMRQAPSKEAPVIRTLSKGTKVEVLIRGEGWTMIRYQDHVGYVMSRYLIFP